MKGVRVNSRVEELCSNSNSNKHHSIVMSARNSRMHGAGVLHCMASAVTLVLHVPVYAIPEEKQNHASCVRDSDCMNSRALRQTIPRLQTSRNFPWVRNSRTLLGCNSRLANTCCPAKCLSSTSEQMIPKPLVGLGFRV